MLRGMIHRDTSALHLSSQPHVVPAVLAAALAAAAQHSCHKLDAGASCRGAEGVQLALKTAVWTEEGLESGKPDVPRAREMHLDVSNERQLIGRVGANVVGA